MKHSETNERSGLIRSYWGNIFSGLMSFEAKKVKLFPVFGEKTSSTMIREIEKNLTSRHWRKTLHLSLSATLQFIAKPEQITVLDLVE